MENHRRFLVRYLITARSGREADARAQDLCIEQTAEMPIETIPETLREKITGKIESREKSGDQLWDTVISFPLIATGGEITQCLNLLFGNISLKPDIRVTGIDWQSLNDVFPGPALGIDGVRERLGIYGRPLSCSALKPVGLVSSEIGERCYQIARGGLDIIKDDHSLVNQPAAPFTERLKVCLSAVERAADETGKRTAYFPNITGDGFETWRRYEIALELGAGGVLLSPQLTGMSIIKSLSDAKSPLPIMAHPTFSGSFVTNPKHGFTPELYYGELWRALGADAVIYTNTGGRFAISRELCTRINGALQDSSPPFRPAFPVPAGGIQRESVGMWMESYGKDIIFLVGGSLYQHPDGLETASREFQEVIEHNGYGNG